MAVLKVYNGTDWVEIPSGVLDAVLLGYTPAVLADWDSSADPGEVDDALDQLSSRLKTSEGEYVVGPASVTDNRVCRFNGATGKLVQQSTVVCNDLGELSGGIIANAMVSQANVVQHEGAIDITALSGYVAIEHVKPRVALIYNDPSARSSDQWAKYGNTPMSATEGIPMPRAGSIIDHSLSVEITTATAGDVTFEVRIENSNQAAFELEFTSAGGTGVKQGRVSGSAAFSAGNFITVRENESAGGTMAWDDLMGMIVVEFDT